MVPAVASEIQALQAIYGDDAIDFWNDDDHHHIVRYALTVHHPVALSFLVSLSPSYPAAARPQLQLLSKYIGNYAPDAALFGAILRTYMSVNGVQWSPDTLCVFDGLQNAIERCTTWYENRLSADRTTKPETNDEVGAPSLSDSEAADGDGRDPLPVGIEIHVAEPIVDRKSVFVGRACRITDASQVPQIISALRSDKHIARAAHPTIWAYRCRARNTDHDDDGEKAAGGRLAHLLQIMQLDNVLVVVTRYFGGIHLGPDRFKHINNAARNALDIGGFLD
ncbi:hypothetical protein APHAL10511_001609 [Amanita phalloides]|nr:hypothetical protein APHAL10511_001609 [Amanita phalloides]